MMIVGCSYSGGKVVAHQINPYYPKYILTKLPESEVHKRIKQAFQVKNLRGNTFYLKHGFRSTEFSKNFRTLWAEDINDPRRGRIYFSDPKNKKDILLSSLSGPFLSTCYMQGGEPIAYSTTFAIHIEPFKDGLKISVSSFNSSVSFGKEFNAHAMRMVSKIIKVEPVEIENYKVLFFIAHLLGEKLQPVEFYKTGSEDNMSACGKPVDFYNE